MATTDLASCLAKLPTNWAYVAVNDKKQPYQKDWTKKPLSRPEILSEIKAGRAKAIGVCCGTQSGGLLFVDHDGKSASQIFDDWGIPVSTLPQTWTVTSGRDGRFQLIYHVPEEFWPNIHTRKFRSGKTDSEGKPEQVELRWDGCQSVVAGHHPLTAGYSWIKGRSPFDIQIATAPTTLIEKMLRQLPVASPPQQPVLLQSDSDRARDFLAALSPARADIYDDWINVGMALHSLGDDSLLQDWINWSATSTKFKPGDCEYKWKSFKSSGITLGTLGELAKQDGWRSSRIQQPQSSQQPQQSQNGRSASAMQRLEARDLLSMLRSGQNKYRYNVFTQQIEVDEKPIKAAERFYLTLAELGFTIGKEVAMDCIVQVAHETPFDPVTTYLNRVAAETSPTCIDYLATAYLRTGDTPGTIYDEMLKRTLIGAVARAFNPGCKHDTACVLMGDQGAYKSSFWSVLGGEFFSDALGDISNKDDYMVLHRSWIMEWAELDHVTNRKAAGQVKAFLSQSVDMFRVPYGKTTEAFPRRGIIVGTTNRSTGFLVDETGNRRFWVIPVTKTQTDQINTAALLLERDSIWSAAVHAYRNGETGRLPAQYETQIAQENDAYVITNPWQSVIEQWLKKENRREITTEELLIHAIQKPVERQTKVDQMQAGDILKALGYARCRIGPRNSRKWGYRLIDAA